jgi:hypothetical protein
VTISGLAGVNRTARRREQREGGKPEIFFCAVIDPLGALCLPKTQSMTRRQRRIGIRRRQLLWAAVTQPSTLTCWRRHTIDH